MLHLFVSQFWDSQFICSQVIRLSKGELTFQEILLSSTAGQSLFPVKKEATFVLNLSVLDQLICGSN